MANCIELDELKIIIPVNGLKTDMSILSIAFMEDSEKESLPASHSSLK
jgi:hypothetical protein